GPAAPLPSPVRGNGARHAPRAAAAGRRWPPGGGRRRVPRQWGRRHRRVRSSVFWLSWRPYRGPQPASGDGFLREGATCGKSGRIAAPASCVGKTSGSGGEIEIRPPLALRGQRIHAGAMGKGALRRRHVLRASLPEDEGGVLQRPAIGEGQAPGQVVDPVHGRKVRRSFFV